MNKESPYFYVEKESTLSSIKELLELNKKRVYCEIGKEYNNNNNGNSKLINSSCICTGSHETCGIFRGQAQDWPLIPSSYRKINDIPKVELSDFQKTLNYFSCNRQLTEFCKFASEQNNKFPKSKVEQMFIAQHYGINTPLLDWTTNIFVAAYFALDLRDDDDKIVAEPFVFHLKDERHLHLKLETEENIASVKYSALVNPVPLDRRIERQFSVFSFHPHPALEPQKIPIDKYTISEDLYFDLWEIMDGLGYSSSHFFPDYAGLADRVKQHYMI